MGKVIKIRRTKPPFYDIRRDGVTQGLINKFMTCRRMTKYWMQGWGAEFNTSEALTFGSIVHDILEKINLATKGGKPYPLARLKKHISQVEQKWEDDNPSASDRAIEYKEKSFALAEAILPEYVKYWSKKDRKVKWLKVEEEFDELIEVGGIPIRFRGKFDGVYSLRKELWLYETKTKSQINEGKTGDLLPIDLQTNVYLKMLHKIYGKIPTGTLYNIVRRPSLRQGVKESLKDFATRCKEDVKLRPDWYFVRMEVPYVWSHVQEHWNDLVLPTVLEMIDMCDGLLSPTQNTSSCETRYGLCSYLPVCSTYSTPQKEPDFVKRRKVFNELES